MEAGSHLLSKMQNEFDAKFFDEARAAWNANKIRRGPLYYYKCEAIQKDGKPCGRRSKQEVGVHLCGIHARAAAATTKV